jgi:hypothetical protein
MGDILPDKNKAFLSIFAYDTEITDPMNPLEILQDKIVSKKQLIHFLCLGDSSFIRYWECNPAIPGKAAYERWHSYHLREMAYGYFIHNVLLALSPEYINASQGTWFPERSKEISKVGEMLRTRGGDEPARLDFLNE